MVAQAGSAVIGAGLGLEELYEQHGAWLRALCGRLLGHQDALEVDDAVQQVFIVLSESGEEIRDERAVIAWLRRTALHMCANISRSRRARQAREVAEAQPAIGLPSAVDCELLADLEVALESLPDDLRQIVEFRYFEGLTAGEIATILEVKPTAVRKRQQRALDALRKRMGRRARQALTVLVALATLGPAHAAPGLPRSSGTRESISSSASGTKIAVGILSTVVALTMALVLAIPWGASEPSLPTTTTNGTGLLDAEAQEQQPDESMAVSAGIDQQAPQGPAHNIAERSQASLVQSLTDKVTPHRKRCRLADVLIRFDSNKDAQIDAKERQQAQQELITSLSKKQCDDVWKLWTRLEANQNGTLTYEEYLKHYLGDANSF
jgi:RNA polymerase sigma-70 factor (ECF subfamily)